MQVLLKIVYGRGPGVGCVGEGRPGETGGAKCLYNRGI